jgi:hypothetical protein
MQLWRFDNEIKESVINLVLLLISLKSTTTSFAYRFSEIWYREMLKVAEAEMMVLVDLCEKVGSI